MRTSAPRQQRPSPTPAQGSALASAGVRPAVTAALHAPGHPLDSATRTFASARLGHDFSAVRVHRGAEAAAGAQAVGAAAFTVGQDIVFGAGRYAPDTAAGRRLLTHELAHTVQQRPARPDGPLPLLGATSAPERTATAAARNAEAGRPAGPLGTSRYGVARQTPEAAAEEEAEAEATDTAVEEETPPKDVMAGTPVSAIIIDLASGRVGFYVPGPTFFILGNVSTDLKPGEYTVRPEPENQKWVFVANSPGIKPGQRFKVTLEGALPWTLSYPDELPVTVGVGTGTAIDLMRKFDEMSGQDIPEDPTIDGFFDYDHEPKWEVTGDTGAYSTVVTLKYFGGGTEVIDLATVGNEKMGDEEKEKALADGTKSTSGRIKPTVLNRSTVPNLWDLKQSIRRFHARLKAAGEDGLLAQTLKDFPKVFTAIFVQAYLAKPSLAPAARPPSGATATRATLEAQGALRKGMTEVLAKGGTRDVTVRGIGFTISGALRAGKELVVKYSHIVRVSKDAPAGMGKQMHAAFESAAQAAGRESGASSVRVIVELVQNPHWKDFLTNRGYQWMSSAEGIGMTKIFPL